MEDVAADQEAFEVFGLLSEKSVCDMHIFTFTKLGIKTHT